MRISDWSSDVCSSDLNPYSKIIAKYAKAYGVPVDLAHAVVKVESNFNPKARGRAGEVGLMQIKPATARMMGYKGSVKRSEEHTSELQSLMRISYAVFCLKKKNNNKDNRNTTTQQGPELDTSV